MPSKAGFNVELLLNLSEHQEEDAKDLLSNVHSASVILSNTAPAELKGFSALNSWAYAKFKKERPYLHSKFIERIASKVSALRSRGRQMSAYHLWFDSKCFKFQTPKKSPPGTQPKLSLHLITGWHDVESFTCIAGSHVLAMLPESKVRSGTLYHDHRRNRFVFILNLDPPQTLHYESEIEKAESA